MHLVVIEEKVAFYLVTYGFNIKRKYNPLKLIRFNVRGRVKRENKFPPFRFL